MLVKASGVLGNKVVVPGVNDFLDVQDTGFDHVLFPHVNEAGINPPPGGMCSVVCIAHTFHTLLARTLDLLRSVVGITPQVGRYTHDYYEGSVTEGFAPLRRSRSTVMNDVSRAS